MNLVKKLPVLFAVCVLSSGTCSFASTFTSCSVEPTGVPPAITVTDPTSCSLSGGPNNSGPNYGQYSLSASAVTGASGGVTGSIYADSDLDFNYLADLGQLGQYRLTDSLSSQAQLTAVFTTAGPVQTGTITIAINTHGEFTNTDVFLFGSDQFSGFTLTQGAVTYTDTCVASDSNICVDPILPIQLGVPFTFSVGDSASQNLTPGAIDNYDNYVQTFVDDSVTFTLQDQSGAIVDSILVTAPEPATFALAAPLLMLLALIKLGKRATPRP